MKTAIKEQSNGKANSESIPAVEMIDKDQTEVVIKEGFRYLEGRPKQYRADAKAGNFNINGGTPTSQTLSFISGMALF
jgi:hypothetical protein